jgi:hypothetical protein
MNPDAFLITVGLINIAGSGLCAIYTFRSHARDTYVYWGLMHLSYALMPLFGLGDDFIGLQDETRLDFIMGGFSAFFSLLTLLFFFFAALIDATRVKPNKWLNGAIVVIIGLLLILFQTPALFDLSRTFFRAVILPVGLLAFLLFARYLRSRGHLIDWPGLTLLLSFFFSLAGFLSLVLLSRENPWRAYGWYLYSWIGVAGLWVTWYLSLRRDRQVVGWSSSP